MATLSFNAGDTIPSSQIIFTPQVKWINQVI